MRALTRRKLEIFQFKYAEYTDGRSPFFVSIAEMKPIERFIKQDEFSRLFGGYIRFRNDRSELIYLGVWGTRKASKLRRLLRERGASLVILQRPPNGARVSSFNRAYQDSKGIGRAT